MFDKEALREELKTHMLYVSKQVANDQQVQKLCQELKDSRTMAHAKDVEIQKLKNQLQEIQGCHKKLRVNRDDLGEELENIKRKKPREDKDKNLDV
ncbi:hypothetical protein D1007_61779 [Hordeum vulgare]|nr:hypothetical protein D1007_61779 [Hordeum vulgare]